MMTNSTAEMPCGTRAASADPDFCWDRTATEG